MVPALAMPSEFETVHGQFPPEEPQGNVAHGPSSGLAEMAPQTGSPANADAVDPEHFSDRIEKELPFLRQIVRRWHRDKANADDLVQDTVLRALANAHLWEPGSNLRGWLVTIMRNQFLATGAKSKRAAELLATIADRDLRVPDISGARLLLRDVNRALPRLPAVQRTILVAVGIEGKSYSEVADVLGLSVGAVRCHLARARERLRAAIDGGRETTPFGPRPHRAKPSRVRPWPYPIPVPAAIRAPAPLGAD